jgi:hypothetical protein
MKKWAASVLLGLLAGIVLPALLIGEVKSDQSKTDQFKTASLGTIPAGSLLHVRLLNTLTSKTSKQGDPFTGMVTQPITADGKEIVGTGSTVEGHVTFVKSSGRVTGLAEMRVVLDDVITTDDIKIPLAAGLEDMNAGPCAKTGGDEEGTIKGCGKNKKDIAKDSAIGAGMGAGAGTMVGMGHEIDCEYYGNCGGPGFGTSIAGGAAIGAGSVLIYSLLKHEKQIILVQGTTMTFVISRSVDADTGKPLEPDTPTSASKP